MFRVLNRAGVLLAAMCGGFFIPLAADELTLVDGQKIKGRVIEEGGKHVVFAVEPAQSVTLDQNDITNSMGTDEATVFLMDATKIEGKILGETGQTLTILPKKEFQWKVLKEKVTGVVRSDPPARPAVPENTQAAPTAAAPPPAAADSSPAPVTRSKPTRTRKLPGIQMWKDKTPGEWKQYLASNISDFTGLESFLKSEMEKAGGIHHEEAMVSALFGLWLDERDHNPVLWFRYRMDFVDQIPFKKEGGFAVVTRQGKEEEIKNITDEEMARLRRDQSGISALWVRHTFSKWNYAGSSVSSPGMVSMNYRQSATTNLKQYAWDPEVKEWVLVTRAQSRRIADDYAAQVRRQAAELRSKPADAKLMEKAVTEAKNVASVSKWKEGPQREVSLRQSAQSFYKQVLKANEAQWRPRLMEGHLNEVKASGSIEDHEWWLMGQVEALRNFDYGLANSEYK